MKLTALFSIILSLNTMASVYSQNTRFTVDLNGKTVREVFQLLEQQSEFRFFYNDDFSYIDNVVADMSVKNENVEQILEKLFSTSDITYKVFDNNLVVLTLKQNMQQVSIKGKILDGSTNEPLAGANVQVKGATKGATADVNGNYTVEAVKGDVLVYSFIGYLPQEVTVADQTTIDITLQPDVQNLEEVVVVGYGTQKRAEVTGAVTSVSSDKIAAIPVATADQALQGRAVGVTVVNNGSPGVAPTIRIRGGSTINNNEPLYIIDGVVANGMGNLNPNDIESVTILKDASTTAVYGAKGSNGVVLITTKSGVAGKISVTLDAYTGFQYTNKRLDLLNTQQYLTQYANDTLVVKGPAPAITYDPAYAERRSGETDWQDEIFQTGMMQNYNLGITGGTEKSSYRVSMGYLNQEGIIIHTGYERFNFRANSNFKVGDRIKLGETLSLSYGKQKPESNSGGRSIIEHVIKMAPYLPVYNEENLGGFQGPNTGVDGQDAENPVRILELNKFRNNTTNILGSIFGEVEILKGLTYKLNIGMEDVSFKQNQFQPTYNDDNLGATHQATFTTVRKNVATLRSIIITNSLNYAVTLADKHNFDLLAVAESSENKRTTLNTYSEWRISRDIEEHSTSNFNITSTLNEYRRIGYMGRLNYNFDQKYLLQGTVRVDGSSRFGDNYAWGTFPSVSLGWNIHREAFMTNVPTISNLKLRGSWGISGNDNIPEYLYSASIVSVFTYPLGGTGAAGASTFGGENPDLKWEETTMTNIGLDLGLLRNQFTFSAEYYKNKSEDLLMGRPTPPSDGSHSGVMYQNVGSMELSGLEFELGYNDFEGDFQWSASLNIGTSKNEIKSFGGGIDQIAGAGFENENISNNMVGEPMYFFYGYKTAGIFQSQQEIDNWASQSGVQPGDIKIVDVAGVDAEGNKTGPDGVINDNDKVNIGNPTPDVTLGFNLNANYKNFDLNIFINGMYGQEIYNTNLYDLEGMPRLFNAGTRVLKRWTPSNTNTDVPRASGAEWNTHVSDRFVENGSFTRLKNITLGYTIPSNILKNKIAKARLYVSAQNLLTLTDYSGYDPEIGVYTVIAPTVGDLGAPAVTANGQPVANFNRGIDVGNYPVPKSFIVGVQLTF